MALVGIPRLWREEGVQPASANLSADEYSRGLDRFINVCVDVLYVNSERKTVYLAKRVAKPQADWWELGGSMRAGEEPEDALARILAREIGLSALEAASLVREKTFTFVRMMRCIFKDRQQEPQNHLTDSLIYVLKAELSEEERRQIESRLDPNEYDVSAGLREFTYQQLLDENVVEPIVENWRMIFAQ